MGGRRRYPRPEEEIGLASPIRMNPVRAAGLSGFQQEVVLQRRTGRKKAPVIQQSLDVASLFTKEGQISPTEGFFVLGMDGQNRVSVLTEIHRGGRKATTVDVVSVMQPLVLSNASGFIIVHTHPGGDPAPSRDDKQMTQALKDAGEIMTIQLLDHVIVGAEGAFYSFADYGIL